MNDEENKPQPWIDPALEARIVAHILGETSAFEAAELERLLAENPELAIFKRRIEAVHALVGSAVRPGNPKIQLSPERRRKLLETIGVPVASPQKVRVVGLPRVAWWLSPILIRAAACLIMTTLVLVIFSSIHVYRNAGEPPSFEGESGGFASASFTVSVDDTKAGRAASPLAADEKALGATLSAGVKPQVPGTIDLTAGSIVTTGVVTRTLPGSDSDKIVILPAGQVPPSPANETIEYLGFPQANTENVATLSEPASRTASGSTFTNADEQPQELAELKQELVNKRSELVAQGELSEEKSQTEGRDGTPLPSVDGAEGTLRPTQESESPEASKLAKAKAKPAPAATSGPVIGGNRSASTAISANSVDALLFGVSAEAAQDTDQKSTVIAQTLTTGGDHRRGAQADRDAVPALGDIPLAGRLFREEAGKDLSPSSPTANVINQPVFSTRDGKVEFDGFVNYGSPIMTVPSADIGSGGKDNSRNLVSVPEVTTMSGQRASTQVVREFEYPSEFHTANVVNQPVFAEKDGRVVQVDGFINYGNPITIEPTEEGKVGLTKYLLKEAQNFSATGRNDLASKRYQQMLSEDPSNIAAREGLAAVNSAKTDYRALASNETQNQAVLEAATGWERPVRRFQGGRTTSIGQTQHENGGDSPINRKLDSIIIPRIDFQDVTVREAVEFLRHRAKDLDFTEEDPAKKGLSIMLKLPPEAVESQAKITLGLTDIPLRAAVNYVANAANLKLKVEPYAVVVVPLAEATSDLVTKEYKVPPGFIPAPSASGSPLPRIAGATTGPGSLPAVAARSGAREHLESLGITFPPGATTYFIASSNKLIVKNTASNLELIDTLVEAQIGKDGSPSRPTTTVGSEIPPYLINETLTAKQRFSTFSLHVSDVSFQLAKDALAKGTMPDPARIRPEEFYNAFDYNDPAPGPGEEVACRIEQCAHPFLQQRNLVRIAVKAAAAGRAAGQPLRLTILLDTSGSMEREDRAVSVRRALQTLTTLLGPSDRVTLIGFARTPRLLAEQVPGDQAGKLVETADRTPSEGGTNLEEALALASEMALKQKLPAAQNRIVLLTDGAANLGNADPVRLARQIEKTRQQGISFDACGVGANGLNDEMLEALTRKGDGRYYFLNKPGDADAGFAKQLAGAFRPAAENVKVQVVFNPARVSQYRLIGFEKHLLKKEDFRNDKVQAAELSAEEAGVALYQVEALPEGDGELGEVFVRFRDPATGQMVERSWTMPYEAQARSFDQASPSMQLAATAALLAEKLRGNPQVDLDALKPVVNNLRSHYPHQARVRELLQMFDQLKQ